jgi:hypothetical protein
MCQAYILNVVFSDVQYEERKESCSSGWESKNTVGEPKSIIGGCDIVPVAKGSEETEDLGWYVQSG